MVLDFSPNLLKKTKSSKELGIPRVVQRVLVEVFKAVQKEDIARPFGVEIYIDRTITVSW